MSDLMKYAIMISIRSLSSIIGLFFYYLIFWLIFRSKPRRPKEILTDKHIYYPVRFTFHGGKFFCQFITYAVAVASFETGMMTNGDTYKTVAAFSILLCILFTILPFQKKVDRVVADGSGVTIQYRRGDSISFPARGYAGYRQKQLIFLDENGSEKTVPFPFLCRDDLMALAHDLDLLKRSGELQGAHKPQGTVKSEVQTRANQMGNGRSAALDKKFAQEKQKLYEDEKRYGAYLKDAYAKLQAQQQQELERLLQNREKIMAIKLCREWTGLGLKEAKDMMDQLQESIEGQSSLYGQSMSDAQKVQNAQDMQNERNMRNESSTQKVQNERSVPNAVNSANVQAPTSEKEMSWTLRITDKEQDVISQRDLEKTVDQALGQIAMDREEFVILEASVPIHGVSFVQARKDSDSFMYHAEVGSAEKNDQGRPRILYKNGLMSWDVRDLFAAYYKEQELDMQGWQELR